MNQLELCKAFAKLEGVDWITHKEHILYKNDQGYMCVNGVTYDWYNPISNLTLLAKAMFKYNVNIEHCTQFDCGPCGSGSYDIPFVAVWIKSLTGDFTHETPLNDCSDEAIATAVIECILKAEGKL